jgi:subtilase family serine protease
MERRSLGPVVAGFAAVMAALAIGTAWAAPQITNAVDESQLVTLAGNTRPEVTTGIDRGTVPGSLQLDHMQLQLRNPPALEAEVNAFVLSLQDPASPNYHHWLTAEEFGARFGADDADLATVESWLASHGFTVDSVTPGRMVVDFSGPAAAVAEAFHTEIHSIEAAGELHIANIRDPAIPAALAPVVAGVTSLNDFRPVKKLRKRPNFTTTGSNCLSNTCFPVAPGDLQTIYHLTSVYNSGITGLGQTIAVAEDSDLFAETDFTNFRKVLGLTAGFPSGNLVVTHPAPSAGGSNCGDPGVNSDDVETTLDVEWSSAAAPNAPIELAACNNTNTLPGPFIAAMNLINSKSPPPIISISFGNCEAENGSAFNAAFTALFRQAVAEGISVFVATGDFGPTDCASGTNGTSFGIGINGWAATQFNVAVGGTDFSDTFSGTNDQFWSSTNSSTFASAKSYVPEMAWNDTCASTLVAQFFGGTSVTFGSNGFCNSSTATSDEFQLLGGGEGGPSGCFTGNSIVPGVVSGSCKGNPKPSWQQGVFGNPADGVRDVPDVSMFAADGVWSHYYLLCFSDTKNQGAPCTANPAQWPTNFGGTSFATPVLAGIQALVNQKTGARQGNPNPVYYALAAREYGTAGNAGCNADLGASVGGACVFNDVTLNQDAQPCQPPFNCFDPSGQFGVLSVSDHADATAYAAHAGWDFPTGLGTVNAANLVANWASVAP